MPIYDCGEPECEECQRAFGPDRSKAIADYTTRDERFARMERVRDAARGDTEKCPE